MFRHKVEKIYYSRVINRQAVKAIVAKCEAINEKKILHSRNNAQYTSKSNAELLGIYRDALSMYLKYQSLKSVI